MAPAVLNGEVMSKIESFRDLLVWQKSIDLAVRCHRVAKRFPRDEQPALGYQTRKSSECYTASSDRSNEPVDP